MNLDANLLLLAACCVLALAAPACAKRSGVAAPAQVVAAPQPRQPAGDTQADLPVSVPQTQVTLPSPQPVQADAQTAARPESPNPAAKPPRIPATPTPKPETRQQSAAQPQPQPPSGPRKRIRPVESPAQRQRLQTEIAARQQRVQDILAKARTRQLSEAEKGVADRIQAFLEQTGAAVKAQDLQQAEALSNRALLLCQSLNAEK